MTGAYKNGVIELLTSDAALAVFTAIGIVVTAVSIVRDARAQKAELLAEEVSIDLRRAA
jgi:hypothetical protein